MKEEVVLYDSPNAKIVFEDEDILSVYKYKADRVEKFLKTRGYFANTLNDLKLFISFEKTHLLKSANKPKNRASRESCFFDENDKGYILFLPMSRVIKLTVVDDDKQESKKTHSRNKILYNKELEKHATKDNAKGFVFSLEEKFKKF